MNNLVVGKRITFGGIVGGCVSAAAWYWNATHPDLQLPAEIAVALTTAITGLGQVFIVNKFGVTQPRQSIK